MEGNQDGYKAVEEDLDRLMNSGYAFFCNKKISLDDNVPMKTLYLIPLFIVTSALAKPCGLEGSIEDRIKDCNVTKGNFTLVSAPEKGGEFYKDTKTKLIWGNRISTDFNHYGSQKACAGDVSEYPDLASLKWRLPTIRELEEAASHGMKEALPNMEHSYWSSTPVKMRRSRGRRAILAGAYLWDGAIEKADVGDLKDGASVRCVARE